MKTNVDVPPPSRPRSVTLLAFAVFLFAAGNAARFGVGLARYRSLQTLDLAVPPAYLLASGAFWGIAGFALAAGLWRGSRRAAQLLLPAFGLYCAQFWLDRLAFAAASTANLNWPFAVLAQAAALAGMAWTARRRAARKMNPPQSAQSV